MNVLPREKESPSSPPHDVVAPIGVDPTRGTDLSLDGLVDPNLTLESTDSPRLRIRFEGDGEALTVVMEADASVGGIERRSQPRSDPGIEETPQ